MAAPAGNQFWRQRSTHGRKPIFPDAETLWNAAVEYFDWAEANPLTEEKVFNGKDGIVRADIAKMRAMTIGGLCIFLDISQEAWGDYRKKEGFSEVVTHVEAIIRDQKFTGAAADLLNPNIIARDLGLAEKQEHTGKDGAPIEMLSITNKDRAKAILHTIARAKAGQ